MFRKKPPPPITFTYDPSSFTFPARIDLASAPVKATPHSTLSKSTYSNPAFLLTAFMFFSTSNPPPTPRQRSADTIFYSSHLPPYPPPRLFSPTNPAVCTPPYLSTPRPPAYSLFPIYTVRSPPHWCPLPMRF